MQAVWRFRQRVCDRWLGVRVIENPSKCDWFEESTQSVPRDNAVALRKRPLLMSRAVPAPGQHKGPTRVPTAVSGRLPQAEETKDCRRPFQGSRSKGCNIARPESRKRPMPPTDPHSPGQLPGESDDTTTSGSRGPTAAAEPLLSEGEPHPVAIHNPQGSSPFVLTCDHAANRVPLKLGDLGLPRSELSRHIGWDIGAYALARRLSRLLDAPLVAQRYSRLVIDCNRRAGVLASIPAESDGTRIPANANISQPARRQRERALLEPYHDAISSLLDAKGQDAALIPIHSFTPVFGGLRRPWHISLMSDSDQRLHRALYSNLQALPDLEVGDNEPYRVEPVDYTVPVHGSERRLLCSMIELRQDLVAEGFGQQTWAGLLAKELPRALERARSS